MDLTPDHDVLCRADRLVFGAYDAAFPFVSNPASDPLIHPGLKRFLPRMLGISIPAMLWRSESGSSPPTQCATGCGVLTAALSVITLVVAFYLIKRRRIAERFHLSVLASVRKRSRAAI